MRYEFMPTVGEKPYPVTTDDTTVLGLLQIPLKVDHDCLRWNVSYQQEKGTFGLALIVDD